MYKGKEVMAEEKAIFRRDLFYKDKRLEVYL